MALLSGQGLGTEICDSLGIDKNTTYKIVVLCDVADAAKVFIWQHIQGKNGEKLTNVLKKYELKDGG